MIVMTSIKYTDDEENEAYDLISDPRKKLNSTSNYCIRSNKNINKYVVLLTIQDIRHTRI
jgi:hypothetical protein